MSGLAFGIGFFCFILGGNVIHTMLSRAWLISCSSFSHYSLNFVLSLDFGL